MPKPRVGRTKYRKPRQLARAAHASRSGCHDRREALKDVTPPDGHVVCTVCWRLVRLRADGSMRAHQADPGIPCLALGRVRGVRDGEFPFVCECRESYRTEQALKSHRTRAHRNGGAGS